MPVMMATPPSDPRTMASVLFFLAYSAAAYSSGSIYAARHPSGRFVLKLTS